MSGFNAGLAVGAVAGAFALMIVLTVLETLAVKRKKKPLTN